MRRQRALITALAAALLTGLVTSCGEGESASSGTQVVATTTHVADLAGNVAGDRAEVVGLLAANSDPHDYEPRPSDAQSIAESEVVLRSGGDLDIWVDQLVESSGGDPEVVSLLESVPTIEGTGGHGEEDRGEDENDEEEHEHGGEDPHWWQDPANAVAAVETIREELIAADPDGRRAYEDNAAAYIERLEALDDAIADCLGEIPAEQRKLVTTHDAFGYFAAAYDVEVTGAAIPALTTQAQPSAGETAALIEQVEDEGVRAIFPEQGLTPQLEQAVADETGATVGGELWGDTLGPEGSTGEAYVAAMAHNAEAMAQGFTGGTSDCVVEVAEDSASQ